MKKILFVFSLWIGSLQSYTLDDVENLKGQITYVLYGITGWCSENKAMEFIDLILEVKPEVYVEIGVYEGASFFPAVSTLRFLGRGIAYAIDPWDTYECIRYYDRVVDEKQWRWWASIDLEKAFTSFQRLLSTYQLEGVTKVLRKTSMEAAAEIRGIDILHIDGDHSETMSLKDVQVYLPKVRSGGYIWLNDSLWRERAEAVDLLLEYCDVVKVIESANCVLFKKR